jgi:hypothetical protein
MLWAPKKAHRLVGSELQHVGTHKPAHSDECAKRDRNTAIKAPPSGPYYSHPDTYHHCHGNQYSKGIQTNAAYLQGWLGVPGEHRVTRADKASAFL